MKVKYPNLFGILAALALVAVGFAGCGPSVETQLLNQNATLQQQILQSQQALLQAQEDKEDLRDQLNARPIVVPAPVVIPSPYYLPPRNYPRWHVPWPPQWPHFPAPHGTPPYFL